MKTVHIATNGSWFRLNGTERSYAQTPRRRGILAYLVNNAVTRENAAPYLDIYEAVWGDEEGPELDSEKESYVKTQVFNMRKDGLRDVIETWNGVGYYIGEDLRVILVGPDAAAPTKQRKRSKTVNGSQLLVTRESTRQKQVAEAVKEQRKHIASCLKSTFNKKLAKDLYRPLKDAGFKNAEIARMFSVSRAAVTYWEELY